MKIKSILVLFCILTLALGGCTASTPDVQEENKTADVQIGDTAEDENLTDNFEEVTEPVYISPLAKENFLLPLENYSWEQEFPPEYVVIHFTSAVVLSRNDPYNEEKVREIFEGSEISIHYIIDRSGNIECYIPENRSAWHAGRGELAGDEKLTNAMNKYSIGIEMLAIGSKNDMSQYLTKAEYDALDDELIGFTDSQYESLKNLVTDICERNDIPFDRQHVIGHSEYNSAKSDPGELFSWDKLF